MRLRRRRIDESGRIGALALMLGVALAAPAAAAAGGSPAAGAAAYDDAVLAVMKANAPLATRIERFRTIVGQYYDMPGIAALVAGSAWTTASAADRQALVAALTRHSAIALARNFASFSGQQFVVDPAVQQRGDSMIVKVTIQGSGGSKTVLYYRMRGARIVDVISSGVSQLAVQRSDLASTASSGGVAAIVAKLDQVDAKSAH